MQAARIPSPSHPTAYETPSVRVTLRDDGVLHGISKPVRRTLEHAREDIRRRTRLLGGLRVPYVLDIRAMVELPGDIKRCYTSAESTATISAMALVAGARFNKILGNLLAASFSVSGGAFPIRVFEDESEALAWARTQA